MLGNRDLLRSLDALSWAHETAHPKANGEREMAWVEIAAKILALVRELGGNSWRADAVRPYTTP
jgi:hypothetical protein